MPYCQRFVVLPANRMLYLRAAHEDFNVDSVTVSAIVSYTVCENHNLLQSINK